MVKVFVYGSLREGFSNNYLLQDSKFLGSATIEGFEMFSLGAFPAITLTEDGSGQIHGEVYEVDQATFQDLDALEGFPTLYQRRKVDTEHGEAWVYTMDRSAPFLSSSSDRVETGDWLLRESVQ